jgi:hypothetical protein
MADRDVATLVWQFLNADHPADGPLDRRLDALFGTTRLARHADIYNIILDRVVTYMSVLPRNMIKRTS